MKRLFIIIALLIPTLTWGQDVMSVLSRIHNVTKGETASEIARKYGVSEADLIIANPDVRMNKLKKGTLLTIPQKPVPAETQPVPTAVEQPSDMDRTLHIGVVLPFERGTEKGARMQEFYRGFLMAADSVRREGRSMEIHAWDSGSTVVQMEQLLASKEELSRMDIIFGPGEVMQTKPLADFATQHGIRLVLPFPNSQPTEGHPLMYTVLPSATAVATEAAIKVAEKYTNRNYIIVRTGEEDSRGRAFTETLKTELAKWGQQVRELALEGDDFAYETALNQYRANCLVPDNTGIKALNILTAKLKDFRLQHPKYNICLQGYPEWLAYTKTLLTDMYQMDTYVYTPYYSNPLTEKSRSFEQNFMRNFGCPTHDGNPRQAMLGFDVAYHFLHQGSSPAPYQTPFRFVQETEKSGNVNRFVQLIRYTPEGKIEGALTTALSLKGEGE